MVPPFWVWPCGEVQDQAFAFDIDEEYWNHGQTARVEFPRILDHVTSRGNAGQPLFLGDKDRLFSGVEGKENRDERIRQGVVEYGYKLREVGEHLGLCYSTVSQRKSKVNTCPPRSPGLLLPPPHKAPPGPGSTRSRERCGTAQVAF